MLEKSKGHSFEVLVLSALVVLWHVLGGAARALRRTWEVLTREDITAEMAVAIAFSYLAAAAGFVLWLILEILFWAADRLINLRLRYWALIIFLILAYVALDRWILATLTTPF